jgi:hypothetical protein
MRMCVGLMAGVLWGQSTPQFKLPQRFLQPGDAIEIYGTNLGPSPGCGVQLPPVAPFPTEACGVTVTVNGIAVGLRYVGTKQINVDLPKELPEGPAPVQVCVRNVCSEPVMKEFSTHTAFLSATGPLYAGMPLWIEVAAPSPYRFAYPCRTDPWDSHGRQMDSITAADDYKMEVRRNGVPLAEAPAPNIGPRGWDPKMGCVSGFGVGGSSARFPLHLLYRIDAAGTYSIRLTCSRDSKVVMQSAWTDIEVQPFSQPEKDLWLTQMEERIDSAPPSELVDDIVPSLLASPDESALRVLLPVYSNWLGRGQYMNGDIFIAAYLRNSLTAFDPELLRRMVPAKILCPPDGACH